MFCSFFYAGKELEVVKEKGERAEELEIQIQKLERDNDSLQKKVANLGITCEKVWCVLFSAWFVLRNVSVSACSVSQSVYVSPRGSSSVPLVSCRAGQYIDIISVS